MFDKNPSGKQWEWSSPLPACQEIPPDTPGRFASNKPAPRSAVSLHIETADDAGQDLFEKIARQALNERKSPGSQVDCLDLLAKDLTGCFCPVVQRDM